jgi:hypothetical protein
MLSGRWVYDGHPTQDFKHILVKGIKHTVKLRRKKGSEATNHGDR